MHEQDGLNGLSLVGAQMQVMAVNEPLQNALETSLSQFGIAFDIFQPFLNHSAHRMAESLFFIRFHFEFFLIGQACPGGDFLKSPGDVRFLFDSQAIGQFLQGF